MAKGDGVTFDEIEEHRDRVAGLDYDAVAEGLVEAWSDDAYEPDDPKSEGFHDRYADVWDMREGK